MKEIIIKIIIAPINISIESFIESFIWYSIAEQQVNL